MENNKMLKAYIKKEVDIVPDKDGCVKFVEKRSEEEKTRDLLIQEELFKKDTEIIRLKNFIAELGFDESQIVEEEPKECNSYSTVKVLKLRRESDFDPQRYKFYIDDVCLPVYEVAARMDSENPYLTEVSVKFKVIDFQWLNEEPSQVLADTREDSTTDVI